MNSEISVRLVILSLTVIVLCLIGATLVPRMQPNVAPFLQLAGVGVGALGSLLANSGNSVTAKSGGTVEMPKAEKMETDDSKPAS